ncbi:MAG: hypothetical protein J6Z43_00610 [Clostridiales bacterium]|nr:hypothetical protein [Clostridiales bacterium]
MEISNDKIKDYKKRLLLSRMRILCKNGFYGLLLMHMEFELNDECRTAATNGLKIMFSPDFMDELSDNELDFVLMHEILHVVLKHCLRGKDLDNEAFNIACDIVVNSNIMHSCNDDPASITLRKHGESMHLTPDGHEGYEYTAEEVYNKLYISKISKRTRKGFNDDHAPWGTLNKNELAAIWDKRLTDAAKAITIRDPSNTCGNIPMCIQRILMELNEAQTDWRTLLNEFVQEEVTDYSFMPPDRRYDQSGFFLPDLNDNESFVKDILFMIDTSGSMSDDMITAAYSEVKGAVDQYDGRLQGMLGFFDAEVVPPKTFADVEELKTIRPAGGGGTRFDIIFDHVRKELHDSFPSCIIILTDGYAPFPPESTAMGIPVIWLINNKSVTPPWGRIARIVD